MKPRQASLSVPVRRVAIAVVLGLASNLAAVAPATAATMTASEVQAAVETWVRSVAAEARPDAVVERLEPYPATGRPAAYIVHLAGGGYCLAGADDRLLPVTLYQPTDAYDSRIPDLKFVLDGYVRRLDRVEAADPTVAQYATMLAERREDWAALVRGVRPPHAGTPRYRDVPTFLTLPLTSAWDQGSPYNDQCPVLTPGSDEHVKVGCVATAAAQIMNYWQWPPSPTGVSSTSYTRYHTDSWISAPLPIPVTIPSEFAGRLEWVSTSGGQLRMNGYWDESLYAAAAEITSGLYSFALATLWSQMSVTTTTLTVLHGLATFDWSLMRDDHTDPPDAGDAEVAELSYHFAVATAMNFGVRISTSNQEIASVAYDIQFRYDSDVYYSAAFDLAMLDEIAWLRPVQLAGHEGDAVGHSWVVQGYDAGTAPVQYLMNLGWGDAPIWYSRDEFFPDRQTIIQWIAPEGPVRFVGGTTTMGDGSPSDPYANLLFAAALAPSGATLIFKAGSDNLFIGTIDRPMTLKGIDVTIGPQ
jgi:hypothetical protein